MNVNRLLLVVCLITSPTLRAQPTRVQRTSEGIATKLAHATRLQAAAPHIDGVLDDAAWSQASPITDFVQKIPHEGASPTVRTEVRLLYDEHALYVAARMYRDNPKAIRTSITRRDGDSDAETFSIALDTYLDRRTAYSFTISSGGVRGDAYLPQDSEDSGRETQFDPIWSARTRIDSLGWTAEMRIPFSQLRFNANAAHTWGMQLTRNVSDIAEREQWVLIPVSVAGFASRFGQLEGVRDLQPARHVELLPYVATALAYHANDTKANPFLQHADARVGGDLKVGLGPNLTLDATINPDFGQVEADPAVVNLTAFETVFDERRPFFIEGNELLTGRGQSFIGRPSWFYSRRIGAAPRGTAQGDFIDAPTSTTILSAAKVTGRLRSGLSVGVLAAVTPREYARAYHAQTGVTDKIAVEPTSAYTVVRLQQEFGTQQSNVGVSLTDVQRSLGEQGGLNTLLGSSAMAGGVDWKLRYNEGMYEITGWAGGSNVNGTPAAISRLQRNSAHYFQRPDQTHIHFDSTRTSLTGSSASLRLDKNAGRFSLGGIQLAVRSPEFEINDVGQMKSGDDIDFNADVQLRDTKPNRFVRIYNFGTATQAGWDFGGARQYLRFSETASTTLHNFMRLSASLTVHEGSLSDDLTRGGPLMPTPNALQYNTTISSRANVPTTWSVRATYFDDAFGGWSTTYATTLTVRPASRWQASVDPTYSRVVDTRQYIATRSGGSAATFGQRYIFSSIERSTISARFRLNYAFTPNFTVEGYAEPFAASGHYSDFGEMTAPRSAVQRVYGSVSSGTTVSIKADGSRVVTDGVSTISLPALDFNRLSFRSNLVLRWEWLPGSTAFLIWQQSRAGADGTGRLIGPSDLVDATRSAGDNYVVAKISYLLGVH